MFLRPLEYCIRTEQIQKIVLLKLKVSILPLQNSSNTQFNPIVTMIVTAVVQ